MSHPFSTLGWLCLFVLFTVGNAQAEDGKELFQKLCSGCHTIGGGDGAGPDLKGVTGRRPAEWLARIISEPDKLSAEKDPDQLALVKKYGMEMPKLGVSREDALKIIAFLGGAPPPAAAQGAPATAAPAAEAPKEVVVTPQLLSAGRALFTGQTPFAKGGAPCVSCHALSYPGVYGGTLAADLTQSYAGMGESGLRSVLKSLSFPVMKRVYQERPLSDQETDALLALFKDASARKGEACTPFPLSGLGSFVILAVAALIFKRRMR